MLNKIYSHFIQKFTDLKTVQTLLIHILNIINNGIPRCYVAVINLESKENHFVILYTRLSFDSARVLKIFSIVHFIKLVVY